MSSSGLSCLLVIGLALHGFVGARELLECKPSANAASDARGATAQAVADTLALAFGEVTTCAGVDNLGENTTELQLALSLAISTGADKTEGECGASGSVDVATQAVTRGVLEEVVEQAGRFDERSAPLFQARSAVVEADLSSDIQARSAERMTPEEQAQRVADAVVNAIKDVLKDLKCGTDGDGDNPPPPPPPGKKCAYVAGTFVGRDC